MMAILDDIIKNKKDELQRLMIKKPLAHLIQEIQRLPKRKPHFFTALKKSKTLAVIAEIKRCSPSRGILRKNFKPVAIAQSYEKGGACALSILTDQSFFGGSISIFKKIREATKLPLLRKDFTLDVYQVMEARLMGADAVLLIAEILSTTELKNLNECAARAGLDVLFEVHTPNDIKKVLPLKPPMIGINNRDLYTFKVDLSVTERLIKLLPRQTLVVSESGIQTKDDLMHLKKLGIRAALIGESLIREKDPGLALKNLRIGL